MCVPTFVDLQGFTVEKQFIVKEVAVLKNGTVLSHYTFASPMSWHLLTRSDKSRATWLTTNHHEIQWNDGNVPYNKAKRLITAAVSSDMNGDHVSRLIYVKGYEKREWLADLLDDAKDDVTIETLDVDYEDIASLNKLDAVNILRCNNHTRQCALQNVLKLFNWWSQRQRELYNL